MIVIKKDLTEEPFNDQKIVNAVNKSASRVMINLSNEDYKKIIDLVWDELIADDVDEQEKCTVEDLHNAVEAALDEFNPKIAKSYKDYRNYKKEFIHMMDDVYTKSQAIRYIGDKSNANTDSALVATKRSLIFNELNKELYRKFFMTRDELQACKDGYIYIHDQSARLDTMNCCLFDVAAVLSGGFEMGNVWYNEPKTLDTAFDVMGDIILSTAAQQYGGFTVPQVDKILESYAEKSYQKYYKEYCLITKELYDSDLDFDEAKLLFLANKELHKLADEYATNKVKRDFEQGWQGIEYKLNTVGSSRGDYPFVTMTFGLATSKFGKMASITFLNVHKEGQGKDGNKKPVLFPKLVFLYDENLHGSGKINEDVFNAGIECSMKTMYPDWLSLTGEGYVPSMYKKYGTVVSPMGCRAFLSPWYERGGMEPADENDKAVFEGRFNLGVVSLHLPMILAKAQRESRDFYEVLDYYLEMIRGIHKRTYDYIGEMKASTNPIGYCEGGFYGGHLKPDEKIKSILKPMTLSFGITALNELQELYNRKSLVEDGQFAVEVMEHINKKIDEFKHEDGLLYAIYGTPAESLCFSGDTVVQTYGGNKKISEITTDDLVYSYNEELKKIELKPVKASKMTQENALTVTVKFDNGQEIRCTPNHRFAKRIVKQDSFGRFAGGESVTYTEAQYLKPGDRIKSNYITINIDGHYKCTTDQYIHDINAEYFYGKKPEGFVTHHIDEDKLNNLSENLCYMSDEDHRRHHMSEMLINNQFTKEGTTGRNNPFFGKTHSAEANEKNRLAHLGKNNCNSKPIIRLDLKGNIIETYESRGMAEEETGYPNISYACNGKYATKENPHEYKGSLWYFADDLQVDVANHKVVSVTYNEELMPVYNIEVADNHNYYVGDNDGILVHNCGLQVEQFRKMYGIIPGVSDREYVSNSFHCGVWEDITPIEKQDLENRFWNLLNGGKIQYVRYPINYNREAVVTLVRRAMKLGYYEGVNLSLAYCDDCGHEELDMDVCPVCGSTNLTKIDRMNGYLSYSRVHGDTRLNKAKMVEISERKSM